MMLSQTETKSPLPIQRSYNKELETHEDDEPDSEEDEQTDV